MNPQPDAWVGAIGGLFAMGFVALAIWRGIVTGVRSEGSWDTFKLGEVYDEKPYYKPSPTNFMRAAGHGNGALRRKERGKKQ